MKQVVVFDNLVQPHPNGIAGMTQNVKALVSDADLVRLEEAGRRAREAAAEFRQKFAPK